MRYFVTLSYDGTRFHGWQVQPNGISVQGELQRGLSLLLRGDIQVTGAGRTDAGVHARTMVAHFDYEGELDCKQLAYKMNRMLAGDISIRKIKTESGNSSKRSLPNITESFRKRIFCPKRQKLMRSKNSTQ